MRVAFAILCCVVSFSLCAQEALPWQEYGKKVSTAQTVAALDGGSFGQAVSLYDGSTSFSAIDISVPGNNELPVSLGRRYAVEDRFQMGYLAGFGNWDIDIPHIEGTFAATQGWVVGAPNAANRDARCSVQQPPYLGTSHFDPEDIWSGYRVHAPGVDGEEALKAIPGAYGAPADGHTYPWTTASQGRLRCITPLKDGYLGEGFELLTPEGVRYRFDKVVERTVRSIKKPVMGILARKRVYVLASRVEDRHGNWVSYSYTGDKLQSITSSDGRNITLVWSGDKVVSATTNGRNWTYQYGQDGTLAAVVNPDSSRWTYAATGVLKAEYIEQLGAGIGPTFCDEPGLGQGHYEYSVTHPSGAQAKFTFDLLRHYRVGVTFACTREIPPHLVWTFQTTNGPQQLTGGDMEEIIDLMNDGKSFSEALYLVKPEMLFTQEDPIHFDVLEIPGYDRLRWSNYFDLFSLSSVLITGLSVESQLTQYQYEAVTSQGFCYSEAPCDFSGAPAPNSLPSSKWVTVLKPNGDRDRHRFGIIYAGNEGRLLERATGSPANVLRTSTTTFVEDGEAAGLGFPDRVGQPLRSEPQLGKVRPIRQSHINQDGAVFAYTVNAFDSSARPKVITRSSSLGYLRQEASTYEDNFAKWVLGQTASITCAASTPASVVCDGDDVLSSSTFDLNSALPLAHSTFGKLRQVLTYNSDGTVATVKDGNGRVTTLSNWKRGIPQAVRYPATAEAPSGSVTSASVDDNGWIEWVTDEGGGRTCYRYDWMGRVDRIRFPAEGAQQEVCDDSFWNETTIEFRPMIAGDARPPGVEVGQWRQYISTGNYRKAIYFDALWRPVISHEYDAANPSATLRAVSTSYDIAGRIAFQSYPSTDSIPAAIGIWTFHDALDRVKEVQQDSEQGQLITRTEYLGTQVRVTGPDNEQTLTSYQAFDEPSYESPVKIEEPMGRTTLIPRDTFGKPAEIERKY